MSIERRMNRRRFIELGASFLAGTVLGGITTHLIDQHTDNSNQEPLYNPTIPKPDLSALFKDNRRYTQHIIEAARDYMQYPVKPRGVSSTRESKERELFHFLEDNNASAGDVLFAIESAGSIDGRSWGMELFWQKRQKGELRRYGIMPLDQKYINWSLDHNIDPRVLAIARECVFPSYELLKAGKDLFFEAIPSDQRAVLNIENTIPNPGVVSMLQMTETGVQSGSSSSPINQFWGMVFIGGDSAVDQINTHPDWFPQDIRYLEEIAVQLERQTGLPYHKQVDFIPGSQRGDPSESGSGGAIGPQFMPSLAKLFMGWYDTANARLGNKYPKATPFGIYQGMTMCITYLAAEFYARHGEITIPITSIIRPGYDVTKPETDKIRALHKWNPTDQAILSLNAGYSYFSTFGRMEIE